ncbi:MAG: AraC family ligand binding domain-containing protein [Chitinophagaceae bacterium]|nr:AraC family ligand binding domain-containing protein [Chitinophagaceae bacterium]
MTESISRFVYKGVHSQVLLFTMKSGDLLKTHRAPVNVLIIAGKGSMEMTIEEKTIVLQQGDHILLEANTKHSIHAIEDLQFYLIKLEPHG